MNVPGAFPWPAPLAAFEVITGIKQAMDPDNRMNPGSILDLSVSLPAK